MAGVLSPISLVLQWFNDQGVVLAGGKINTYVAGTTTPLATYTTSALSVANANPIVLQSNGRMPAEAWLPQGSNLKIVLTDAVGNVIPNGTLDNIPCLNDFAAFYPRTTAEIAASVTPVNYQYPEGWVQRYGTISDSVSSYTALQNCINVCAGSSPGTTPQMVLPGGVIRCDQQLQSPRQYLSIRGAGMNQSIIRFTNVGAGASCFNTAVMNYFSPEWEGFTLDWAGSTTGHMVDWSNVSTEVYWGSIRNVYLYGYKQALYAPRIFSFTFDNMWGKSETDHIFRVFCGPGVTWIGCNATWCPLGKAGFRLAGNILMHGCNGLYPTGALSGGNWQNCGYWGIFGNDTTAADGFQNDFSSTSYPSIQLFECNIEDFVTCGIRVESNFNYCFISGVIDRQNETGAYDSLFHFRVGSNTVTTITPARFAMRCFKGTGVPNGGAAYADAWVFADSGTFVAVDETGWIKDDFNNFRVGATSYPPVRPGVGIDATNAVFAQVVPSFRASSLLATTRLIATATTVTYSASMTIDASLGNRHIITATNGTAFTINAPTSPLAGQRIVVTIRNTSGGALGAVTWNAVFKLAAWTSPATANSRSIEFEYDGTNWIEIARATADVPN